MKDKSDDIRPLQFLWGGGALVNPHPSPSTGLVTSLHPQPYTCSRDSARLQRHYGSLQIYVTGSMSCRVSRMSPQVSCRVSLQMSCRVSLQMSCRVSPTDVMSGLVINNVEDDKAYLCNTNKLDSFSNIVGISPVIRHPVLIYENLRLTSLAATVVNQFTVVFVGTETGRLKKILLAPGGRAHEYSELVIFDGHRILPDMTFDLHRRHIYLMTDTNVTKVAVETCSQSDSCHSCLSDGDPYCGWCSLERKRFSGTLHFTVYLRDTQQPI
ncbi:Plexin-A2 [Bulinus truncatus]|nr:Plexin-A2 [Bulinus truncatus]